MIWLVCLEEHGVLLIVMPLCGPCSLFVMGRLGEQCSPNMPDYACCVVI